MIFKYAAAMNLVSDVRKNHFKKILIVFRLREVFKDLPRMRKRAYHLKAIRHRLLIQDNHGYLFDE